jgi:hypothetical protein
MIEYSMEHAALPITGEGGQMDVTRWDVCSQPGTDFVTMVCRPRSAEERQRCQIPH